MIDYTLLLDSFLKFVFTYMKTNPAEYDIQSYVRHTTELFCWFNRWGSKMSITCGTLNLLSKADIPPITHGWDLRYSNATSERQQSFIYI